MTNTNDREALAALLRKHGDMTDRSSRDGCSCDEGSTARDYEEHAADAILAAGFTRQPKPHTVETVEELEALDERTPVLPPNGIPQFSQILAANYRWVESHGGMRDRENWLPATVLTPATQPTTSEIAKQAAELLATISAIGLSQIDATAMEALIELMRGSVASEPTDAQVEAAAEAVRTSRAFQAAVAFGIPNDHEGHRHASNEFARAALEAAAKMGGDA